MEAFLKRIWYGAVGSEVRFYLKGTTVLFVLAFAAGMLLSTMNMGPAASAVDSVRADLAFLHDYSTFEVFVFIFLNNIGVTLMLLLSGIFFGIIPVLLILLNGYTFGMVVALSIHELGWGMTLSGFLPHAIFEIPALLLAASYGIFLGECFTNTVRQRTPFRHHFDITLRKFSLYIVPLLFLAALIETFIVGDLILKVL